MSCFLRNSKSSEGFLCISGSSEGCEPCEGKNAGRKSLVREYHWEELAFSDSEGWHIQTTEFDPSE